jgi:hypothetical protein
MHAKWRYIVLEQFDIFKLFFFKIKKYKVLSE